MSVQIFLEGQLLGVEDFLSAPDASPSRQAAQVDRITADAPREFLRQHELSPMLLGSSGGGQFLLVLPDSAREAADSFFASIARDAAEVSKGRLRLIWASTENLGSWGAIRSRLDKDLSAAQRRAGAPDFAVFDADPPAQPADPTTQSVLRGDVDSFALMLERSESVEAYVTTSVAFKTFFAGELQRLTAGKAEVLFTGGDDFALAGDWRDLVAIGAELHRLFERFVEQTLGGRTGPEGKTLSMALAVPEGDESLREVFARAGAMLAGAKTITRDAFHLFGRTIDWKQFPEAESIRDLAVRLVKDFRCSPAFISELAGFYPETQTGGRLRVARFDRPWRFHRRLAVTLDPERRRGREFERVRNALGGEIIGKNVGQARLRPAGRVALEWARRLVKD